MSLLVATLRFVFKRAWYRRAILLPIALGLLGVVTVLAGVPLFSNAANYVSLQSSLHMPGPALSHNLEVRVEGKTADAEEYQGLSAAITQQIAADLNTTLFNTPSLRTGFTHPLNRFPVGSDHVSTHPLGTAALWFSSSMNATHLRLLQGHFPSPNFLSVQKTNQGPAYEAEAIIAPDWAAQLHLKLNDVLEVVSPCPHPAQACRAVYLPFFRLRIVGFVEPKSLQDPAWFEDLTPFDPANEGDPAPLWVSENVFESVPLSEFSGATYLWFYYLNLPAITPANAPAIISGLIRLKNTFTFPPQLQIGRNTDVLTGLDLVLKDALSRLFYTDVVALVVIVPGVALLLLYLGIAAFALAEQSREELALMQSRGASHWQMLALSLSEAILLCLGGLLLAPFLAGLLAFLLVRLSFFGQALHQIDFQVALPTLASYAYATLATLLCLLVLLLPTLQVTQDSLLTIKRRISRPRLLALPLRLGPGLLLTALGLYGYIEIQQRSAFFLQNLQGMPSIDWVAAIAPTVLLIGVVGLSLLLLPPMLARLDRAAQHLPSIAVGLASRTLARRSGRYSRLVFLLTLTISLGLFAGLSYGTLSSNLDDRAGFLVGADLRLVEGASNVPELERQAAPLQDHLRLLPGVTDGMNALRDSTSQVASSIGSPATPEAPMLAVDSARFARIAYWRSDFADASLDTLMRLIGNAPIQQGALPTLVSDQLLSQTTFHLGDAFSLMLDTNTATFFQFRIVGTFHYFPTLPPGQPAILCDLTRLLSLLNQGSANQITPNEVWLKLAPTAPEYSAAQVEQALLHNSQHQQVAVTVQQAFDRAAITQGLHAEPLQSVIFGTLMLDFIIAALLSIVGLVVLLHQMARQRIFELNILRVLGLSQRQLVGMLGWEELTLILLALLLGVPLGVGTATLALPALAFDESGQPLFPPLVFRLSVPQTLQDALLLCACLVVALLVTALIFRRLRVQEVLRLGEE